MPGIRRPLISDPGKKGCKLHVLRSEKQDELEPRCPKDAVIVMKENLWTASKVFADQGSQRQLSDTLSGTVP